MTTICLNMIVCNEAHVIRETLNCVRPYISNYFIVDTGSTDNTIEVIREYFGSHGIPGRVVERPWRSFGENRTEALELARQFSDSGYLWVIDADDILIGEFSLAGLSADAYSLRYGSDFVYWRPQIFRRDVPWRYVGVLHEYAECDLPDPRMGYLEGGYHVMSRRLGHRNRDPDKYLKDARILEKALESDTDNVRYVFYLGQSWFDAGRFDKALETYRRRVDMGGWEQETFYSRYRIAQCMERLEAPWADARAAYQGCFDKHMTRAEPLHWIAHQERLAGNYDEAYAVASRAVSVPHPGPGALFVENDVYRYRARDEMAIAAYYLGFWEEAFRLNSEILASVDLPDIERQRIETNRDYSVPRIKDSFLQSDEKLVHQLVPHKPAKTPLVTLTITSCRRLDLFVKTIRSFLKACTDIELIDRWICIDDNSDDADRREMERLFPFFEFIWKDPAERGHARSMNLLIEQVKTPYWLHLEDDWHFFETLSYIGRARDILDSEPELGQVLFNRHYAEVLADRNLVGGSVRQTPSGIRYLEHLYLPEGSPGHTGFWEQHRDSLSNVWWPHYSLRPSLVKTDVIKRLAPFDEDSSHFELDLAQRYEAEGWRSAFFETISCLHTGRLTSERDTGQSLNAYDLNDVTQFGQAPQVRSGAAKPGAVTVTITSCKRLDYFTQTVDSFLQHLGDREVVSEWICIDDNSSDADRARMAERYPFFRFILKGPDEKGHANSMNRLLKEVNTRFVMHLEDDWLFSRDFKLQTLTALLRDHQSHQVVLCQRPGGWPLQKTEDGVLVKQYVYTPHHPQKPQVYRSYDALYPPGQREFAEGGWWWPGYSLNPSLLNIDFFRSSVGLFDERIAADTFEYDYAAHAHKAGARILVADYGVTHIGKKSAYVLNRCPRWVDAPIDPTETYE